MRHLKQSMKLGSDNPADRVREAVAIVRLDGFNPSPEAIELTYAVAAGHISADIAVEQILLWYTNTNPASQK